jgi:carbonic anhydrase
MCIACIPAPKRVGLSRRSFAAGFAGWACTGLLSGGRARASTPDPSRQVSPKEALQRLSEGNLRYINNQPRHHDMAADRHAVVGGQSPFAAVLGCADSRVSPELVFDQGLGDLFVVRVAGNFVNAEGLGSLEYGAAALGTAVILVLGHTSCGAINATLDALRAGTAYPGDIATLVRDMTPAVQPVLKSDPAELARRAVEANVLHNVAVLRQSSPVLRPLIEQGRLAVAGGVYDLASGTVSIL